jgi:hypothetical protein
MWPGYYKLIEPNSDSFIKTLFEAGQNGTKTMEMYPWLRQVIPLKSEEVVPDY